MVSADYTSSGCALISDSRDDLHVVYVGLGSGYSTNQVWYAWRKEGVWQTPVRISSAAGMESHNHSVPAPAVDAADDLHVVWWGLATGYSTYQQIWWAACQQGAWQTPTRLCGIRQSDIDMDIETFKTVMSGLDPANYSPADVEPAKRWADSGYALSYNPGSEPPVPTRPYLSWCPPCDAAYHKAMEAQVQGPGVNLQFY